jgi:hypothetical protein
VRFMKAELGGQNRLPSAFAKSAQASSFATTGMVDRHKSPVRPVETWRGRQLIFPLFRPNSRQFVVNRANSCQKIKNLRRMRLSEKPSGCRRKFMHRPIAVIRTMKNPVKPVRTGPLGQNSSEIGSSLFSAECRVMLGRLPLVLAIPAGLNLSAQGCEDLSLPTSFGHLF